MERTRVLSTTLWARALLMCAIVHVQDLWPAARTCTHQLRLPAYVTKEELSERLVAAMQHATGFGND
jgi:hypothetical protein